MTLQKSIKDKIIKKQKNKCSRCGKKLNSPAWFYHKIGEDYKPISGGGSDNLDTIVGLCYECHFAMEDREKMKKQFGTSGNGIHLIG